MKKITNTKEFIEEFPDTCTSEDDYIIEALIRASKSVRRQYKR